MRIAANTQNGKTISKPFGRGSYYAVLTVEGNRIVAQEMRDKEIPHCGGAAPTSPDRYTDMVRAIADCQVLLARGISWGAHDSLLQMGIEVMMTDIADIQEAAQAYLDCWGRDETT